MCVQKTIHFPSSPLILWWFHKQHNEMSLNIKRTVLLLHITSCIIVHGFIVHGFIRREQNVTQSETNIFGGQVL